jgi:hypothetical protein
MASAELLINNFINFLRERRAMLDQVIKEQVEGTVSDLAAAYVDEYPDAHIDGLLGGLAITTESDFMDGALWAVIKLKDDFLEFLDAPKAAASIPELKISVSHESIEQTFEVVEAGAAGARITAKIPHGADEVTRQAIINARITDLKYALESIDRMGLVPPEKKKAAKGEANGGGQ